MNKRLLRAIMSALTLAALAAGVWYGYEAIANHPVHEVVFSGDLKRVPQGELEALAHSVERAADGVSLQAVREAALRIPWVREATVRRHSPDAVEVAIVAHEPIARWGEGVLVSREGELFSADFNGKLPRFRGPEGAIAQMTKVYPRLVASLRPLGAIAELRLSPRGSWQVVLESGFELEVGRGELESRIERFIGAYPQLAASGVPLLHADLRHANGFALRNPHPGPLPRERGKTRT